MKWFHPPISPSSVAGAPPSPPGGRLLFAVQIFSVLLLNLPDESAMSLTMRDCRSSLPPGGEGVAKRRMRAKQASVAHNATYHPLSASPVGGMRYAVRLSSGTAFVLPFCQKKQQPSSSGGGGAGTGGGGALPPCVGAASVWVAFLRYSDGVFPVCRTNARLKVRSVPKPT